MEISPIRFEASTLDSYAQLFKSCFPASGKFSRAYLEWLYCRNPAGSAIGYDARDGEQLAAHYACIPVQVVLNGKPAQAMLSLNTATHPRYQGRGLFTQLADRTYAHAADLGIAAVCGIANGNSTPGFVHKLGFTLIEPLYAAIGAGHLTVAPAEAARAAAFRYEWDRATLTWRCANPGNPIALRSLPDRVQCSAISVNPLLRAYAELPPMDFLPSEPNLACWMTPRLFLGLVPGQTRIGAYRSIPMRLRPSPLNFIFRALSSEAIVPERGESSLSFLDFDAY